MQVRSLHLLTKLDLCCALFDLSQVRGVHALVIPDVDSTFLRLIVSVRRLILLLLLNWVFFRVVLELEVGDVAICRALVLKEHIAVYAAEQLVGYRGRAIIRGLDALVRGVLALAFVFVLLLM